MPASPPCPSSPVSAASQDARRRRISRRLLGIVTLLGLSALARPGGGEETPPSAATSSQNAAAPSPAASAPAPATSAAPSRSDRALSSAAIVESIQKLAADVQRWGGSAGVIVLDVASGDTIASLNPHTAFNPASNAKLLTAVAALRVLGSQHRYLTGLYGRPVGDRVAELVLRGQGDPSLQTEHLWEMVRELRASGVRKVGSIGVDQGYFDERYVPPAFDEQPKEWAPFRAPVAAVALNQNTVLVSVRPGERGREATIAIDPPGFVDINGAVRTTAKTDPEKVTLTLEPRGSRLSATLGGTIPEKSRPVQVRKRVDDPRLLAGYALRAALKDAGIEISADIHATNGKEKRLLASHRSAPLGELLKALGKDSDNFYAEMLFKALGASKKGDPATAEGGATTSRGVLSELGAFEEGIIIKNGSGLFDANRATPWSTATLLRAAYRDASIGPEVVSHLAIGGVDGTLRSRFRSFSKTRAIRAKTGTLDAVAALSGYVLAPAGGAPVAFAIFVNGVPGKVGDARQSIDKIVEAITLELWKGRLQP